MGGVTISRRNVLRSIATGTAVGAFASATASAREGEFNVGTSTGAATREAERRAESVTRVLDFGDIGEAVTGRFSDEDVRELRRRDDVRYVEHNGTMHAIDAELDASWGVDRVDAEVAHANDSDGDGSNETGSGADIAIIDTGIDGDHTDLDANIGAGTAFVDCGSRTCGGPPCPTSNCNHSWSDDHDHGTHCAGIADAEDNSEGVVGVSTEATLHAVKVLDCNGCGSYSDVAAGIKYVADQGWDVGSMSLGGSKSSKVEDAVEYAHGKGVLLVAAAGNDGPCTDCVGYPAAEPEVIAVSATNKDDCLADFSSQGPEIELAAPGKDVYSTVIGGYDTFSGTSMACPHVSGASCLLMANGYSNTEARDQLNQTAEDIGLSDNEQGNGLVDAAAALGLDSSDSTGSCGSSDNPPTVDSLSLGEVETSDSDAEFDASWDVSDSDGDLDSVDLTLTDTDDGETEDSKTVDVSGDTASGTTRLIATGEDGSGHTYEVEAIVTDSNGNTDSATATETESESGGGSMGVSDISFSEKDYGPGGSFTDLMTTVTIKEDSNDDGDITDSGDDPVSNATVYMTLTHDTDGDGTFECGGDDDCWDFSGDTDSNGEVTFTLKRAPDGDYEAEVTDVTHDSLSYDSNLDEDNPDTYTGLE